ncbi:hypothetical protein LP420_04845 [Massilia sp. B-10]|nr:hypothetical protein LP420_04845 [Massilia sp. B-10]
MPNLGVDDFMVLKTLSENRALGSFGFLLDSLPVISASYGKYVAVGGDPWEIPEPVIMPDNLKKSLITHYEGEIKGLEYIAKIRNEVRTDVCPLCGSTKPPGQVDHFIPKEDYPEFSFFIPNLVSACDCNLHKGKNYKGQINGERLLHPYFDRCMSERLIYLSFEGDVSSPDIKIKVMLKPFAQHCAQLSYSDYPCKDQAVVVCGKCVGQNF